MENELAFLKERLEAINKDLYWFWEDHLDEDIPDRILVCWGQLTYMMKIKANIEMKIAGIERELNQNGKIY